MDKKKILDLVFLLTLIVLSNLSYNIKTIKANSTLIVESGASENFQKIQDAINAANPGDVILVRNGVYYENVCINKTISLIGEDKNSTIIDGGGVGIVLTIIANNVKVQGFTIQNGGTNLPDRTIFVTNCREVIIENNMIRNSLCGIELRNSNACKIINNVIMSHSWKGIFIAGNDNEVCCNTIANNSIGVSIAAPVAPPNRFYRNNFVNNTLQAEGTANWDNGAEGNYWSDYSGEDINGDGIGDTETPHLGIDFRPLMEPWRSLRTFYVPLGQRIYCITIFSNSTIASFEFDHLLKRIRFNSTGPYGVFSFCNASIPKELLIGPFAVSLDDIPITLIVNSNETHSFIYFNYTLSTHKIQIDGSYIKPVANFAPSTFIQATHEPVFFNASLSYDPDGNITIYYWDFGDGSTLENSAFVSHKYALSGRYHVSLTVKDDDNLTDTYAVDVIIGEKIDVEVDVGVLYFKGETAEFYVITSILGQPLNVTSIRAELYYKGTLFANLSGSVQHVADGVYRIVYRIPLQAANGTYALVVAVDCGSLKGFSLKCFLVDGWIEATLADIKNGIATIIVPNLGEIEANLTQINARLIGIEGVFGILNSSLGEIKVNLNSINASIVEVKGSCVIFETGLGEIAFSLDGLHSAVSLGIVVVCALSVLTVTLTSVCLALLRRRR
ncbi:MAG: PKD domain-containing protein [Candidatus Bathyarchaeia archaeon]